MSWSPSSIIHCLLTVLLSDATTATTNATCIFKFLNALTLCACVRERAGTEEKVGIETQLYKVAVKMILCPYDTITAKRMKKNVAK